MSHYLNTKSECFFDGAAGTAPIATDGVFRNTVLGLMDMIRTWDQRYRQRQHLRDLPRSLLDDIGISEAEAMVEAAKPFWKP